MRIRSAAVGPVLAVAVLAVSPGRAADCDCSNLTKLQVELRNATRLQAAFQGQVTELRQSSLGTSQAELQRFAKGAAHANLEADGSAVGEVDYVPYGQDVAVDRLDSLSTDQLCAMRPSSAAALEAAANATACTGIGRALRAHEGVHVALCRSIGYRGYLGMHGADRAVEEGEAYGVQIAVLRAEIIKVLERLNPRIEVDQPSRLTIPVNEVWNSIVTDTQADVRMTRAVVVDPDALRVRFEGQGRWVRNTRIEGNCSITGEMPVTQPVRAGIETNGLEVRITYSVEGVTSATSMECRFPPRGGRATIPLPISSGGQVEDIVLPLRNGAEQVTDLATTPAAAMLAQGRIQLSGEDRTRLIFDCPAP